MTLGTYTTPSSFLEEEEAANMPYTAGATDGGVPVGAAAWMEGDIEWIVKEEVLKDIKVRFVPLFVVITL